MKKALGTAAALAVVLTACGVPATGDESASGSSDGLTESIGVTGHWTIDIIDPDGTIDETVSFQNRLTGAPNFIANLIAGESASKGSWVLRMAGTGCEQSGAYCIIDDASSTASASAVVTVVGSVVPSATIDVELTDVYSEVAYCPFDPSTRACVVNSSGASTFSAHELSEPAAVAAGQTVQVEIQFEIG